MSECYEHIWFYPGRDVSVIYKDYEKARRAHFRAKADPLCIASVLKNGYGIMSPNLHEWERGKTR